MEGMFSGFGKQRTIVEVTELGAQYWGVEITTINILVSTLGSLYIYVCVHSNKPGNVLSV